VQENADAIKWTGQWRRIGPDNAYSERFAAESTQPDSTATLRFTGDQISWVSATGPDGGKAVVYLDDQEQARVDLHSGDRHDQVTVWDSPALSSGQHTLVIRAVGDGHVVLDVLVVTGS
jgi:methionine-rich copper-binding protein CopC